MEAAISAHAPKTGRRLLLTFLSALLLALVFAAPAFAEPAKITQAKEDAAALRAQVEQLGMELEIAVEDYQYATHELEQIEAALAKNTELLEKAEKDLAVAEARLSQRVEGLYRDGDMGFIEALFSARSFSDLVNRFDLLSRVGEQDSDVLERVGSYRADVEQRKAELAQQEQQQTQLVADAKDAKARIDERLADQKRALKGKEQLVAQLEQEERERQARLAEEARRQAAAAAAAAQAARESNRVSSSSGSSEGSSGSSSSSKSSGSSGGSTSIPDQPSSGVGGSVIDIAMRYIGVPYVWAGASPSGFDCSGFTMYVYGKAGVSLPHSSRAQFGYGVAVGRSGLEPGDLVFFGSPIHHVGIYVGGGNYIHSPYSGSSVRINSMSRGDFAGARRIL
jgi:cell wall-associated NlpC family hydrolase